MQKSQVLSLGQEDPLEKEMAAQSRILAWEIPWTAEPGWLQSMGSQSVGQDLATKQRKQSYLKPSEEKVAQYYCSDIVQKMKPIRWLFPGFSTKYNFVKLWIFLWFPPTLLIHLRFFWYNAEAVTLKKKKINRNFLGNTEAASSILFPSNSLHILIWIILTFSASQAS